MILFNEVVNAKTADDAWLQWIDKIDRKQILAQYSRDGNVVYEVVNATTIIEDPTRCIMLNKVRKMPVRYAVGEMLWYMSGNTRVSAIKNYSDVWKRMSDDGETVNSNYGYCMQKKFGFNQIEYVEKLLRFQPNTRQAVIHIKTADNRESKDVNCTIALQFFIRDMKLYMTVYMRSNDLWMGFPFDVFQFANLQVYLSMRLGVELGTYTHVASSLHLYERNYNEMLKTLSEV